MKVLFLLPLVTSIGAAWYMAFESGAHLGWRIIVVFLVLAAAALQALYLFVASVNIHFLIPLLIQVVVSIGVYFHALCDGEGDGW
jgi:hypothetical protein